jgi:probable HAF family extracellular repeat protein
MEKGTRTMKSKANLFRALVVLSVVVVAVSVALFGVGLRSAETQTTAPSYYKVEDLGTLGGSRSWPSAINDKGQVVGSSYLAGGQNNRAFLYKDGKMTDLGTLGGTSSEAKGINKSGQVVGWSDNSSGERRAFIYDSTNGMKDLNDLIPADSGWTIEEARAINSNGQIAANGWPDGMRGSCSPYAETWDFHTALVLRPGTTATYEVQNLGTLGGDYSYATGMNDSGQVVGRSMPMVNSTTPLSGATNVGQGTNLTATFSEKMGPPPSIRPPSSSSRSTPMAPRRRSLTWL